MAALNLFPSRVPFVNPDGTLTQEAYRTLQELVSRTGGVLGNSGETVIAGNDISAGEARQSMGGDVSAEVLAMVHSFAPNYESVTQPLGADSIAEMLMQPQPDRAMTAPESITVGASPFIYRANRDGHLVVTGGTVSKQEYGRGAVFTDVGLLTSMLPIMLGDAIRVTYTALPTLTFIPR